METEPLELVANGRPFRARAWGEGAPVLLLHGFPDDADSMEPLGRCLAAMGNRVVAPFLRGYGPGPTPPITTLDDLADDVDGLQTAIGASRVVGHDWGAAAAYAAAVKHPRVVRHVVGLSVPPLHHLLGAAIRHPGQLRRSAYMLRFQVPGAETWVQRDDFAFVEHLWRTWSPGWTPPPERLAGVKRTLSHPGSLTAALGYYRGLLRSTALLHLARSLPCPHGVVVGARDECMAASVFDRVQGVVIIPDCGHFLHLEAPEVVAEAIQAVWAKS